MFRFIFMVIVLAYLPACNQSQPESLAKSINKVLSKEERANLTPDDVLNYLKEGNARFINGTLTQRDHSAQVRDASTGQYPKALILSCLDSRIPVEDVFDLGIGDLFVARVAGNFENEDILGSMEFAGIHDNGEGVKLIVVMGHSNCGAIKHALKDTQAGNITAMLTNIKPAIEAVSSFPGEKSLDNLTYLNEVTSKNVEMTINDIRKKSKIISDLETEGKLKIVGATYDMHTGIVSFMQ